MAGISLEISGKYQGLDVEVSREREGKEEGEGKRRRKGCKGDKQGVG